MGKWFCAEWLFQYHVYFMLHIRTATAQPMGKWFCVGWFLLQLGHVNINIAVVVIAMLHMSTDAAQPTGKWFYFCFLFFWFVWRY